MSGRLDNNAEAAVTTVGFVFFGLMAWAAVDAFGWLHGLGAIGAVWLLAPYRTRS